MREYRALRAEWLRSVERQRDGTASILAVLHNAHFKTDGVPWIPADFIGTGNREERRAKHLIEQYAIHKENARLARIRPDQTEGIPDWAKGEYGR